MVNYLFIKHMIHQLKSGKRFQWELSEQSNLYKLQSWRKPTYANTSEPTKQISFGDIEIFEPKIICLRRVSQRLVAILKSPQSTRRGFVSQNWVLWYLTQMRDTNQVHLIVNNGRFTNGYTLQQGQFGPSCANYQNHPNYSARCIRTYLDNKKNFFFA